MGHRMLIPRGDIFVPQGDFAQYAAGDAYEAGEAVSLRPPAPNTTLPPNVMTEVKNQDVPFIAVENAHIQTSPLGGQAFLKYAELEYNILETMAKTPAEPVVKSTPEAAGAAVTTIAIADVIVPLGNTTLTALLYPFFMVQFSAPQLNQLPAGVISMNITMASEFRASVPLNNLQIAVSMVTSRIAATIVPSFIIQAKPRTLLGRIDATPKSLVVSSTGLATGTIQTVIVPGSTHGAIASAISAGR